ncbi:MAG: hypothetical protein RBU21_24415 [FCB group bacterium]|nr:hypothetical protein [FCB group bacterium]
MSYSSWRPYVPVAARRAKARKEMEKLRKKGKTIEPVELDGRKIAASFWGAGWCDHLESFSDYENRLPRGRTYVRNGSVCHLEVRAGQIEAIVMGSELYKVIITIEPLARKTWKTVKSKCHGQIGSMLELLRGEISNHVMEVVSDRKQGLFPQPGGMKLKCSCADWATMCKHVAAVLYGVGSRLDQRPELLFLLRGVDAQELVSAEVALPAAMGAAAGDALADDGLAHIFGIDIDTGEAPIASPVPDSHPHPSKERTPGKKPNLKSTGRRATAPKPSVNRKSKPRRASVKKPARLFDSAAPTGAAIAALRKQHNHTVSEFADALGVNAASVTRWENTPGPLRLQARPLRALTAMQEVLLTRKK